MPVTRKPVARPRETTEHPTPDEATIRAIIARGGSVVGEHKTDESERKLLQLRLPTGLIARIDATRERRSVPPSRHHWILEAIHEKLLREERDEAHEAPAP